MEPFSIVEHYLDALITAYKPSDLDGYIDQLNDRLEKLSEATEKVLRSPVATREEMLLLVGSLTVAKTFLDLFEVRRQKLQEPADAQS